MCEQRQAEDIKLASVFTVRCKDALEVIPVDNWPALRNCRCTVFEGRLYLAGIRLKLISRILSDGKNGSVIAQEQTTLDRVSGTAGEEDAYFYGAWMQEFAANAIQHTAHFDLEALIDGDADFIPAIEDQHIGTDLSVTEFGSLLKD